MRSSRSGGDPRLFLGVRRDGASVAAELPGISYSVRSTPSSSFLLQLGVRGGDEKRAA